MSHIRRFARVHTGGLRIEPDVARILMHKLSVAAQFFAFGLVLHIQSDTKGCGTFESSEFAHDRPQTPTAVGLEGGAGEQIHASSQPRNHKRIDAKHTGKSRGGIVRLLSVIGYVRR